MDTLRSLYAAGRRKRFRYQPMPVGAKPPEPPLGSFWEKGPSTLQSCGRSRLRQLASANVSCCAPGASPLKNFQPKSKVSRIRTGGSGVWATKWPEESSAETRAAAPTARPIRLRRVIASFELVTVFISGAANFLEDGNHPANLSLAPPDRDHVPRGGGLSDGDHPTRGGLLGLDGLADGLALTVQRSRTHCGCSFDIAQRNRAGNRLDQGRRNALVRHPGARVVPFLAGVGDAGTRGEEHLPGPRKRLLIHGREHNGREVIGNIGAEILQALVVGLDEPDQRLGAIGLDSDQPGLFRGSVPGQFLGVRDDGIGLGCGKFLRRGAVQRLDANSMLQGEGQGGARGEVGLFGPRKQAAYVAAIPGAYTDSPYSLQYYFELK